MRVHLLWGRCCRRGTTAACAFYCAAPDASVARAPVLIDVNLTRTRNKPQSPQKASIEPVDESEEASAICRRFAGKPAPNETALRYPRLICSPAGRRDRGIEGAAGIVDLIGPSRRCPQRHGEEPATGLPQSINGQAQGAPGALPPAADESVRCAPPTRSEKTTPPELRRAARR